MSLRHFPEVIDDHNSHESKSWEIGRSGDQVSPKKSRCMIQDVPGIFECAMIDSRKFDVVVSTWMSFRLKGQLFRLCTSGARVELNIEDPRLTSICQPCFDFRTSCAQLDRRADLWSTPEMLHASKPEVERSLSDIQYCCWGSSDGYGGLCSDETLQDVRRRVSVEQCWKLRVA